MQKREIEDCITLIENERNLYMTQLNSIRKDKELEPIKYSVIGKIRLYDIILMILESKIK